MAIAISGAIKIDRLLDGPQSCHTYRIGLSASSTKGSMFSLAICNKSLVYMYVAVAVQCATDVMSPQPD